jgi:hypothetical protein
MRQRARTDPCGGRSAMVVPTATVTLERNFGSLSGESRFVTSWPAKSVPMPSDPVNTATRRKWRELGFFYGRDDERRVWRLRGSRRGYCASEMPF